MRVLGIDPGYGRCGVAVMDSSTGSGQERLLYSTCIETKGEFAERLADIAEKLAGLIDTWQPEALAIEKLFFSKNVKTAMQVAEVRGAIISLAKGLGLDVREYTPSQVKIAITGSGNADKNAVSTMLERMVKIEVTPKYDDEYDAIAIALTDIHTARY